jgi:hypothetical protein
MQNTAFDDRDIEDDGQPALKCDIEINNVFGKTARDVDVSTAAALRWVADQIEAGALDSGFHPIKRPDGEVIGEVYLDHTLRIYG